MKDSKLFYTKPEDRHKLVDGWRFIDLHNIEWIDHCTSQYKNYYEFHLRESNRLWQIRVTSHEERILFTDYIFKEWSKLRLTLVRYKQVLSEIKLTETLKDLCIFRSYTISNVIDDHIHVEEIRDRA